MTAMIGCDMLTNACAALCVLYTPDCWVSMSPQHVDSLRCQCVACRTQPVGMQLVARRALAPPMHKRHQSSAPRPTCGGVLYLCKADCAGSGCCQSMSCDRSRRPYPRFTRSSTSASRRLCASLGVLSSCFLLMTVTWHFCVQPHLENERMVLVA